MEIPAINVSAVPGGIWNKYSVPRLPEIPPMTAAIPALIPRDAMVDNCLPTSMPTFANSFVAKFQISSTKLLGFKHLLKLPIKLSILLPNLERVLLLASFCRTLLVFSLSPRYSRSSLPASRILSIQDFLFLAADLASLMITAAVPPACTTSPATRACSSSAPSALAPALTAIFTPVPARSIPTTFARLRR